MSAIKDILKKYWGYDSFRPLQEDIIESIMSGRDTFVLLPTGGGKSLCFQIPALAKEGITIVISPLIALMKDQVGQLRKRGIIAEAIFSGMHKKDVDRIFDNCIYGDIKMLYISPERLMTDLAEVRIKKMNVSFVAIDEAHCISQWGHDFRPSYLEINRLREWHPKVPFMALTATANDRVQKEIVDQLSLKDHQLFRQSFGRKNLNYIVMKSEDKLGKLAHVLQQTFGSAIVYVRSRRKTQELAQWLQRKQISAAAYHAGLSMEVRSNVQKQWLENRLRVIVATNAFGMGIDKPDVRTVVHYGIPPSIEDYYQEAGRAGRDGKTGYCIVLYHNVDIELLMEMNEVRFPSMPEIRRVYKALFLKNEIAPGSGEGMVIPIDLSSFSKKYNMDIRSTYYALKILEQDGWIILSEGVFTSSRAKIRVGKEVLYDYQLKHREHEQIIKLLMRGYEGIILDKVRINENQLAQRLKVGTAAITKQLLLLQKNNIIDYTPASDEPRIIVLRDRVASENLTIDKKRFNNRKDWVFGQMRSLIAYLDETNCRENFLLNYFDEKRDVTCGHCDTCRKRKQQQRPSQEELLDVIPENGIILGQLIKRFSSVHEAYVKKMLSFLEGEKQINMQNDWVKKV